MTTNELVASIVPEDRLLDDGGREWRLVPGGRPFFDDKRGTQGRWVAVLELVHPTDSDRRVLHWTYATPTQMRRLPAQSA